MSTAPPKASTLASVTDTNADAVATPRLAAGALFTDAAGRVLLVRGATKEYWDIPGGYVRPHESPYAACVREVREELGLTPPIEPQPLVIDWAPWNREGDKILYVFPGKLDHEPDGGFTFPDGELVEARYVDPAELDRYTIDRLARRLRTALDAINASRTIYAEHGTAPQT